MMALLSAAVVVELCADRFIIISLDADIEPRGDRTLPPRGYGTMSWQL